MKVRVGEGGLPGMGFGGCGASEAAGWLDGEWKQKSPRWN